MNPSEWLIQRVPENGSNCRVSEHIGGGYVSTEPAGQGEWHQMYKGHKRNEVFIKERSLTLLQITHDQHLPHGRWGEECGIKQGERSHVS